MMPARHLNKERIKWEFQGDSLIIYCGAKKDRHQEIITDRHQNY